MAVIYNEENFIVEDEVVEVPEGVEAAWVILTPKTSPIPNIKKILVGGMYIAQQSQYKEKNINHKIELMFFAQSQHESQLRFFRIRRF